MTGYLEQDTNWLSTKSTIIVPAKRKKHVTVYYRSASQSKQFKNCDPREMILLRGSTEGPECPGLRIPVNPQAEAISQSINGI